MTDDPHQTDRPGDRIAKVIARAGLASRRDAERMVEELRVKVNGRTVSNVAHNVTAGDRVTVDDAPLPQAEGARLWLYHKPAGLVTSERDEKGRETVFETLPAELGRVLSVGRLDLNSEGLLLLTNDGALKRKLELPATGWLRRYRVRVNGTAEEAALERLRAGIEVEGDFFAPMQVALDRQQGANAWLTVALREGRNREVRRAMAAVGLYVNRLIRVSYGPFQLGNLEPGAVEEVKPRILREQLGGTFEGELADGRKGISMAEDDKGGKPRKPRSAGDRLVDHGRGKPGGTKPKGGHRKGTEPDAEKRAERAGRPDRPHTGKPPVTRNDGEGSRPRGDRPGRDGDKPRGKPGPRGGKPRAEGAGPDRSRSDPGKSDRPRTGGRDRDDGKPRRTFGDRPPRDGESGDRPRKGESGDRPRNSKPAGARRTEGDDPRGPRSDRAARTGGGKPYGKPGGAEGAKPGAGARSDRRPGATDAPKETKAERTARLRADSSISLRKGGQRGRGVAKPKRTSGKTLTNKPDGKS
ncbi:pseudouridine synthase [uncultured Jannaschia sp.]|uniref:pseudouridine synthase n=1 Tax=uncultured Jannaschia sp. TaxID=293347 RepID=UPI00260527F7|nr:pseudouridine synthase [uncultured Jannaschia sp.]